ncbi:MAG: 50S ribosomal protein L30 [Anaerolineaceae bacterium]
MPKKKVEPKMVKITLIKSIIGYPQRQKDTVHALGLRRINQTVEHADNPALRGMIAKVVHLVAVEE